MTAGPTVQITRTDQQVSCTIDGEVVVMSLERHEFYALNETASAVWDLTATPCSIDEIVGDLVTRYAVDEEVCATGVHAVVERMAGLGIVQEVVKESSESMNATFDAPSST